MPLQTCYVLSKQTLKDTTVQPDQTLQFDISLQCSPVERYVLQWLPSFYSATLLARAFCPAESKRQVAGRPAGVDGPADSS